MAVVVVVAEAVAVVEHNNQALYFEQSFQHRYNYYQVNMSLPHKMHIGIHNRNHSQKSSGIEKPSHSFPHYNHIPLHRLLWLLGQRGD